MAGLGMYYAAEIHGADILNMSLGGPGGPGQTFSESCSSMFTGDALTDHDNNTLYYGHEKTVACGFQAAVDNDALVIIAAGNAGAQHRSTKTAMTSVF